VTPTLSPEAKPTPLAPPQKPQKPVEKPQPAKKTPPAPHPVKPAVESATHQVHDVKKPEPLSKNILNTLLNLHAHQDQVKPPTHVYNPDQGGDPDAGGSKDSTANSALSGADKSAIGAHLRPCFQVDAGAAGLATFHVLLDITTDPQGIIRVANVDPQDQGKLSDPIFNAYAQRALSAALNVQCANLPLPKTMLGSNQNFTVDFAGQ
jgi:outer membrane biosynthesis protein TonB